MATTRTVTRTPTHTVTRTRRQYGNTAHVRTRRHPRPAVLISRWVYRHAADGARWARDHATDAARSERDRARARYADWNDSRNRFGDRPWVYDATTGEKYDARHPEMHRYLGLDGDTEAQRQRERDHLFREDVEAARLSWWDRVKIRLRMVETDPEDVEQRRFLKRRAGLRGIQNTGRGPAAPLPARPTPTPAAIGGSGMADGVRDYSDLENPNIDPFEYPEELPQYLTEVQQLIASSGEEYAEWAEEEKKKAEGLTALADYMEQAKVVPAVVGPLREAADKANEIAGKLNEAAELYGQIADDIGTAQREAEAEYGDNNVPRFDQAN